MKPDHDVRFPRRRHWSRRSAFVLLVLGLGVVVMSSEASSVPAGEDISVPGSGPSSLLTKGSSPITVPGNSQPMSTDYASAAYAAEKGVSIESARAEMNQISELTAFADFQRGQGHFSGFRIVRTASTPQGELAVDSINSSSLESLPSNVRLLTGSITEKAAVALNEPMTARAQMSGVPDAVASTVDPFTGDVTVWRRQTVGNAPEGDISPADDLLPALRETAPQLKSTASVFVRFEPRAGVAFGGKPATKTSSFFFYNRTVSECTTGFGVGYNDAAGFHGGYLTAGHCAGNSGWKANGNSVSTYWDRLRNAYADRLIMEAGGASWLVFNGTQDEDMAAAPTHIYQGAFYCMYSRRKYGRNCGTVTGVNFPVEDSGITTFTSRGSINQNCIAGDSGGPVWQPRSGLEALPAGLVEAASGGDGQCFFTALDDDLAGSGFALL